MINLNVADLGIELATPDLQPDMLSTVLWSPASYTGVTDHNLVLTNAFILACGSGQQPYCPDGSKQHVCPSRQEDCLSGHWTFFRPGTDRISVGLITAFSFRSISMIPSLPSHLDFAKLHLVFSGQQWISSEQHTACQAENSTALQKLAFKPELNINWSLIKFKTARIQVWCLVLSALCCSSE